MGKDHIEWVFDDAKATIISRGEERDQADGERTIPRCVTAFNAITGHKLSNCDGWLFMEVLKKCRSVQGAYKYDDYRDGVGYAALRAEEARMENEKPNEALKAAADKFNAAVESGELQVEGPIDGWYGITGLCPTDAEIARGHHVLNVILCEHERSNCYECKLFSDVDIRHVGTTAPPASDNRHNDEIERRRESVEPSGFAKDAVVKKQQLRDTVAASTGWAPCECLDPDCPAKVPSAGFVPSECDTDRNELGCKHPYGNPCISDCIDTRGGA